MNSQSPENGWDFTPLRRRNDSHNVEPIRVVVVDDEPIMADLFQLLLKEQHGIETICFPSAHAALPGMGNGDILRIRYNRRNTCSVIWLGRAEKPTSKRKRFADDGDDSIDLDSCESRRGFWLQSY